MGLRMLRSSLRFLLLVTAPVALALVGFGNSACGGCYVSADSRDAQVDPPTPCITLVGGHSDNGCGTPNPTGILVTNGCTEALVIGATTIAPGQRNAAFQGSHTTIGARRSLSGTLGGKPIVISWLDGVEAAEAKLADAGSDG